MKIDHVYLAESCAIRLQNGSNQHKHFASDRWDIELVDFRYFEIRMKGSSKVLALIPFERANYCYPAEEQALTDLSDLSSEVDHDAPLMEVRKVGRPRNDARAAGNSQARA